MAQSQILTQSDAETIGWGLVPRTPDNQLERALPQDSRFVSRLSAINGVLFRLRMFPCPYLELTVPAMPEEAVRLTMPTFS